MMILKNNQSFISGWNLELQKIVLNAVAHSVKKEQDVTGFMEWDRAGKTIILEFVSTGNQALTAINSLWNQLRILFWSSDGYGILLELTEETPQRKDKKPRRKKGNYHF